MASLFNRTRSSGELAIPTVGKTNTASGYFTILTRFAVNVTSRHGADKTEEMGTETGTERNDQN